MLALAAFLPTASAQVAPPPALLVAPANLTAPVATPLPGVVQRQFSGVDSAVLKQLESGKLKGVRLPLFAAGNRDLKFTGREDHGAGRFALTGELEGVSPSRAVLAVWDGVVALETHGHQVNSARLRFAGNGGYWLEELNVAAQGACGAEDHAAVAPRPAPAPAAPAKEPSAAAPKAWDGNHWADLLAYYTPGARDAAGGDAAMKAKIAADVATANTTHSGSGTSFRIRLVNMILMNYTASTTGGDLLGKLATLDDGAMDSAGPDITTYGPDLVHLWATFTDGGTLNGTAYLNNDFGVTRWDAPSLTFAHESGHNIGCRHQRGGGVNDDNGGGFEHGFQASYDWYFLGIYDYTSYAQSVMWGNSASTVVDRFSSPSQQVNFTDIFYGTATVTLGDANNDNRRYVIENRAATVTRREPLFYLFPGSGPGQATPNSPSGTLADVYDTWFYNTRISVNSNAVLRLWQGNYPNPGRIDRKGRLENWGNFGVARIGP